MKFKKVLATLLVVVAAFTLAGCKKDPVEDTYTYRSTIAIEPADFNPHTWETNTDSIISSYAEIGFVEPIYDMEKNDGSYTWAYEMATAIEDYTPNATPEEREKWGLGDDTEGRMYKISLNPAAKWADGTPINADTYVYSMKQLLNPDMRNYRANSYISGDSSIVGANEYFNSGAPLYSPVVTYSDGKNPDPDHVDINTTELYINTTTSEMTIAGYSFRTIADDYGYIRDIPATDTTPAVPGYTYLEELEEEETPFGWIKITEENKHKVLVIMDQYLSAFGLSIYNADGSVNLDLYKEFVFYADGYGEEVDYDETVGLYKVDDYTIMYVLNYYYSEFYFKMSMSSTWLVYEALYEAGKQQVGELVTTNYGTSVDTYMSFGPYKFSTYEVGKQLRFERNENWYGYTDGKHEGQYQTTAVVLDVVSEHATALLGFQQGIYDDVSLDVVDMQKYGNSEWLKVVNTTYTWRLVFNTDLDVLKSLEGESGNNKQVLANINFRNAFSLAIDRQKFVNEAVGAGSPAYSLINSLYMFDVENDPGSVYRATEPAMKAVVDMYGIEYGEGKTYATLKEAYDAVSGFDLNKARELMQVAYEECIADGTYTHGQKISLDLIVTSRDNISEAARKNATVLDAFLKEAIKGTGFEAGGIELNAKNLSDYYNKMLAGACEMIFGAWGGAVYWPYSTIECYVNDMAGSVKIHEGACWDPSKTPLTLELDFNEDGTVSDDEKITMSYTEWGAALNSGAYAQSSFALKNQIMAALEQGVLEFYYCIPLYCDATTSLDSKRLQYATDEYNIMYGFGGLRFLTYSHTDAQWADYVAEQGGTLNYE